MRKNVSRIISAFEQMKERGSNGDSIWTDGITIWSYGTALFTYDELRDRYVFNATQYSHTTTTQQHSLRVHFASAFDAQRVVSVDDLDRGVTRETLLSCSGLYNVERRAA